MQHLGIESIKKIEGEKLVYNFQIDEDESYIANGIIVHNCIWVAIMKDELDPPEFTGFDITNDRLEPSLSKDLEDEIIKLSEKAAKKAAKEAIGDEVDRLLAED